MQTLSKSKLMAFRQCPKRLWLELHGAKLEVIDAATQARFDAGHRVGDVARSLYDPQGKGQLIEFKTEGIPAALARSKVLLGGAQPIFEAGIESGGARAFADVMLPVRRAGKTAWRMVEVKSSTRIKDYHHDDVAIQAFIAQSAGVSLASIALAHVDGEWVYPGGDDYDGLLVEQDVTDDALSKADQVKAWIADAQAVVSKRNEPAITTGSHCTDPYECGFIDYCQSQEPQAEHPVQWLPRVQSKKLKALIEEGGITEMRDVPDHLLNEPQRKVKKHTLTGKLFFDKLSAQADLAAHKLPAYFLDFETIQFAVPIWKGTRPYQQIPFQFSVHRLGRAGKLDQQAFLDLSGNDPSRPLAECLIAACGERGPVFVYSSFEMTRIKDLARRFPRLSKALLAISARIVDLHKIAGQHYYHPSQQGSWSIKNVLPAVVPELDYSDLDEVQDGQVAMLAFAEAIAPETLTIRKAQIERQLLDYCRLDTYATVRLWQFFSGRNDLKLPPYVKTP